MLFKFNITSRLTPPFYPNTINNLTFLYLYPKFSKVFSIDWFCSSYANRRLISFVCFLALDRLKITYAKYCVECNQSNVKLLITLQNKKTEVPFVYL